MKRLTILGIAALAISTLGATIVLVGCRRQPDASATIHPVDATSSAASVREVTIPAGTTLTLSLDETVGSATSRAEDPLRAHLTRSVVINGLTTVPEGSELSGAVTSAVRSARVKGRARIAMRFDRLRLTAGPDTYAIRTATFTRTAPGTVKKDALKVGIPAAAGAVLGGAFGGGKGALIGTVIGGGAGAGYVVSSRGAEVTVPRGVPLSVRLLDAVTVHVPMTAREDPGPPSHPL